MHIQLWKEQAWPLYSSVFPNQGQAAANAICLGTAQGVCAGSYMSATSPDFAMAAWLLEDSCHPHQNLCQGITHISGPTDAVKAYHTELQGLHPLLLAIKGLCSFYAITSGSVIMGCDNLRPPSSAKPGAHAMQFCPCRSCQSYLPGPLVYYRSYHSLYVCEGPPRQHALHILPALPGTTQHLDQSTCKAFPPLPPPTLPAPGGSSCQRCMVSPGGQPDNHIQPASTYYLVHWVLCSLQVHGEEIAAHLLYWLCFDQLPSIVCCSQIHFPSVSAMVL